MSALLALGYLQVCLAHCCPRHGGRQAHFGLDLLADLLFVALNSITQLSSVVWPPATCCTLFWVWADRTLGVVEHLSQWCQHHGPRTSACQWAPRPTFTFDTFPAKGLTCLFLTLPQGTGPSSKQKLWPGIASCLRWTAWSSASEILWTCHDWHVMTDMFVTCCVGCIALSFSLGRKRQIDEEASSKHYTTRQQLFVNNMLRVHTGSIYITYIYIPI